MAIPFLARTWQDLQLELGHAAAVAQYGGRSLIQLVSRQVALVELVIGGSLGGKLS